MTRFALRPMNRQGMALALVLLLSSVGCEDDPTPARDGPTDAPDASIPVDAAGSFDGFEDLLDAGIGDSLPSDVAPIDATAANDAAPESSQDGGAPPPGPTPEYAVATVDLTVEYQTERPEALGNEVRTLTVRVYAPRDVEGPARLLLVSHGGSGSTMGHTSLEHLGQHYARQGYVAAHIGHRRSPGNAHHRWDRPHDVSAVIDTFAMNQAAALEGFTGTLLTDRVGHIGHSWGAYTAHGVAGGLFVPSAQAEPSWNFRDPRVVAMVALSPQGPGGFGAFDAVCDGGDGMCPEDGWQQVSEENTWRGIDIPTFHLIGAREMDGVVGIERGNEASFRAVNWRLYPYIRAPADGRRYLSVLPNGTHGHLGNGGSAAQKRYLAINTRLFFDAYLRDDANAVEDIGRAEWIEGVEHRRK